MRIVKFFIAVLILSGSGKARSQSLAVKVLDERSETPVAMAHVLLATAADTSYSVSGEDGIAWFPNTTTGRLYVSHVSYHKKRMEVGKGAKAVSCHLEPLKDELAEVVVTGQANPVPATEAVRNIKVIGRERIDRQAAVTLRDLLSNDLNFRLEEDLVLGSRLSLQGLDGQKVKILIDGVPVIGRLNGNVDLSQINLNNIERVEIVEGPMSVEYGTDAVAGTINLITKKSTARRMKPRLHTYYETVGRYNAGFSLEFPAGKTAASFTLGRNFFDGFSTDPSSRDQTWNPKEQYFTTLGLQRRFGKVLLQYRGEYFNEGIINLGKAESNGTFTAPAQDSGTIFYPEGLDDYYYTTRLNNAIYGDFYLNPQVKMQGFAAYNFFKRRKNTFIKNLSTGEEILPGDAGAQDTTVFDLFNSRLVFHHTAIPEKISYQLGYDAKYEQSRGERIDNNFKTITDIGFFGSLEYQPFQSLSIQPGVRYAYNSRFTAPLVSSLAIRYKWTNDLILRASYGQGFRAPTLKELYFLFVDENHNILGNDDLKAETSDNYQLSLNFAKEFKSWNIDVTLNGFFNNLTDEIRLVAVIDPSEENRRGLYRNINVARSQTTGFTFNLSAGYKNWKAATGAGLTGIKNELSFSDPARSKNLDGFNFYPQVRFNLSYTYPTYGLTASLFCNYTGPRPDLAQIHNGEVYAVGINRYSAYTISDLTLQKTFWKEKIRLTAGVKNLFDVTNIQSSATVSGEAHSTGTASVPLSYGRTYFTGLELQL